MKGHKLWTAILLLGLLLLAQMSTAQEKIASAEKAETPTAPREAIKVHGHWIIVIRNPDGSVASRREFENSLDVTGQTFLSWLLAGQSGTFGWVVQIGPLCGKGKSETCSLTEATLANDPNAVTLFKSGLMPVLFASAPTTGPNAGAIVLSGSAVAANSGAIEKVSTKVLVNNGQLYGFTSTSLSQSISVKAGQTADVTVAIRFS